MGHNDIVKVLCSEIERAGGKAWTEPRFQLHHADDEHTDIRFSLGGQLVYVDVMVVHPTAATYLARGHTGPPARCCQRRGGQEPPIPCKGRAGECSVFPVRGRDVWRVWQARPSAGQADLGPRLWCLCALFAR